MNGFWLKMLKKKKKEYIVKCKIFIVCEVLNFEFGNIFIYKKCLIWLIDSIFIVVSEINEWLLELILVYIIYVCIK